MSVESMASALRLQGLPPVEKLLLIGIANHDGDGGAWPSIATLATYTGLSVRQTQRTVQKLVDRGLVEVGVNEGGNKKTKNDRRPNLYILHLDGVTSQAERGDTQTSPRGVTPDVTRTIPGTIQEPSSSKPTKKEWDGDIQNLCLALEQSLKERGYKPKNNDAWKRDMHAIIHIDNRKREDVGKVIKWLATGTDDVAKFWRPNIQSPAKLREKWPAMKEKYEAERDKSKGTTTQRFAIAAEMGESLGGESIFDRMKRGADLTPKALEA